MIPMRMMILALAGMVTATQAWALEPALGAGAELEVRLDGDFDTDGAMDIAYVARGEESRTLHVTLATGGSVLLNLDPYPLGSATLNFTKGVLLVEDLTGGTSALATMRRYRFDKAGGQMRLIGLDATYYSRTQAHDGFVMSWNLYTGRLTTMVLRLNKKGGDEAYNRIDQKIIRRPSGKVWLPDTPDPEELMNEVGGR